MNDYERLITIISEQLGVDKSTITADTHFEDDLGADSLDVAEIVIGIENEFDIDVPDEDVQYMSTVGDVVDYIIENV